MDYNFILSLDRTDFRFQIFNFSLIQHWVLRGGVYLEVSGFMFSGEKIKQGGLESALQEELLPASCPA